MDTILWIVIALAVVLVVVVVVAALTSRRRRQHLQERFGSEYDRTVEGADRRRAAERDLRAREERHDELDLRPLSDASRQRYTQQWQDDFDTRSELVSVDHPDVVENYRTAHGIAVKTVEGRTSTEDLRQAVMSYRALFEEMLVDDTASRN